MYMAAGSAFVRNSLVLGYIRGSVCFGAGALTTRGPHVSEQHYCMLPQMITRQQTPSCVTPTVVHVWWRAESLERICRFLISPSGVEAVKAAESSAAPRKVFCDFYSKMIG